jgi:hypothetical protein
MKRIACRELLEGGPPDEDAAVEGPELVRLYWTVKQREKDLARRERYWASVHEALGNAYDELAQRARELQALREELVEMNAGLERRVSEQVAEIMERAGEIDALSVQLKQRVRDRSRELRLALDRAGAVDQEAPALTSGAVVGGRARVIAKLGDGAMGSVYEAVDLLTNRPVALKLLRAADRDALRRFVAEADTASAVNHPSIVRTLHVDVAEDGTLYQLMELVRGVTLRRFVKAARVRIGEAARIGASIAGALAAAHAQGVVHRDIKPENVLLSVDAPGVRVLDFGIAKQLSTGSDGETQRRHGVVGTPGYMAPDQIRPLGATTPAADVYSLGVVLFELIAGQRPFMRPRVEDVLVAHLYAPPPPLGGPPEVAAIVGACLEKQPDARPAAAAVEEQLRAYADSVGAPSADSIGRTSAEIVEAAAERESGPASSG